MQAKGFKECDKIMREIGHEIGPMSVDFLKATAEAIHSEMISRAPVDTGNLVSQISLTPTGNGYRIESGAEYSLYVDQGHATRSGSMVEPDPFFSSVVEEYTTNAVIEPIIDEISGKIKQIIYSNRPSGV